ncbi:MAG: hypothetical protein ACK4RK_18565 [Gemmataceae bacterium]
MTPSNPSRSFVPQVWAETLQHMQEVLAEVIAQAEQREPLSDSTTDNVEVDSAKQVDWETELRRLAERLQQFPTITERAVNHLEPTAAGLSTVAEELTQWLQAVADWRQQLAERAVLSVG